MFLAVLILLNESTDIHMTMQSVLDLVGRRWLWDRRDLVGQAGDETSSRVWVNQWFLRVMAFGPPAERSACGSLACRPSHEERARLNGSGVRDRPAQRARCLRLLRPAFAASSPFQFEAWAALSACWSPFRKRRVVPQKTCSTRFKRPAGRWGFSWTVPALRLP